MVPGPVPAGTMGAMRELPSRARPVSNLVRQATPPLIATLAGFAFGGVAASDPRVLVLLLGAAASVLLAYRFPRATLAGVLALVLFDGALRKWMLPGLHEWLYFAKDGLVLLLGAVWLLKPPRPGDRVRPLGSEVVLVLAVMLVYFVLQIFNPRTPSLLLYVFGLQLYLVPLLLIALVPRFFSPRDGRTALRWLLLAAVPVGLLAVIQSWLPATHVLNKYVGEIPASEIAVYGLGEAVRVRVTSTFSYITGFSMYAYLVLMAVPFAFDLRRKRDRWLAGAVAAAGLLSIILSGSRSPLLLTAAGLPLATWPLWRARGPRHALKAVGTVSAILVLLAVLFRAPIADYAHRAQTAGDAGARIAHMVRKPVDALAEGGVFGYGPGSAHQSRGRLLRMIGDWGELPKIPESESARVILELGGVGAILWYGLRGLLLVMLWRWYRQARRAGDVLRQTGSLGALLVGLFSLPTMLVLIPQLYYLWAFWIGLLRLPPPGAVEPESSA